ncbi:MAG: hypothetical protein WC498_03160 [Candidatus Saccharimonadales bacterium]
MKKFGWSLGFFAIALFGSLAFGQHKAAAFSNYCDVMADPSSPGGGTAANCQNGQRETAMSGINTVTEFRNYINRNGKNTAGGQTGGYGFQKIGVAYIKAGLGGSKWSTNLDNPNIILRVEQYSRCINTAFYAPSSAVVRYPDDCSTTALSLVFKNKTTGTIYYAIKIDCGNPLGDLQGHIPTYNPAWTLTANAWINNVAPSSNGATVTSVYPGQALTFTYNIRNNGPGTSASIAYNDSVQFYYSDGSSSGQSCSSVPVTRWPCPNYSTPPLAPGAQTTVYDTWGYGLPTTVTAVKVCTWRAFVPTSSSDATSGRSWSVCAAINHPVSGCAGWTITPSSIDPTTPYTVTGNVTVSGGATGAAYINSVSNFYIHITGPGVNYQNNNVAPVAVGNGTLSASAAMGPTNNTGTYNVAWGITGPQGTVACGSDVTLVGNQFTVAYNPYFSVVGGDIAAGPGFGSGCTPNAGAGITGMNKDTNAGAGPYFGAGAQLAGLTLGPITSFATSLEANGGDAGGGTPSGLAFANTTRIGTKYGGGLGRGGWCVTDYATDAAATQTTTTTTPSSLPSGTYLYNGPTPVTLNGGTFGAGQKVILVVNGGDVFLAGDINYNYPALSGFAVDQVPQFQLLVQGHNIYIKNTVHQLNGFYSAQPSGGAGGTIYTCATGPGAPVAGANPATDYGTCNQPLTFYGAVSAARIRLGRTLGNLNTTGAVTNQPAERFVFTPELWLGNLKRLPPGPLLYQSYSSLPPVL